jgi:hypothetical protein
VNVGAVVASRVARVVVGAAVVASGAVVVRVRVLFCFSLIAFKDWSITPQ